ncbi:MAG TPA: helix-turn-helix domain-containing protein, partial [Thermomicrobiales bacterium]|nr:helix-turn-helix domain-containing protein [Thermomicrobiales bacterium]
MIDVSRRHGLASSTVAVNTEPVEWLTNTGTIRSGTGRVNGEPPAIFVQGNRGDPGERACCRAAPLARSKCIIHAADVMDERTPDRTGDSEQRRPTGAEFLTAWEAAERLGVHERTVRRAIARGALPATKHAGVYRIAPEDLGEFRTGG